MKKIYPRTGDTQTVYLNAVVKDPSIEVGDYTIYNDFVSDPLLFERNNVLYPKSVIRISQCCMAVRNPLFFPIWKEMTALFLKTVPDKGYAFLLSCPNRLALISIHNG